MDRNTKLFIIVLLVQFTYCYDLDLLFSGSTNIQADGKQFNAAQHSAQGEKGQRGYAGQHEFEKGSKGYHDKEGQKKYYGENGGNKNAYNHNNGYYAQQHQGEKGQKGYHFADKGSYAKGHRTKGRHNIHKLDEYKKNTAFFDEDHDAAFKEQHGGFEVKKAVSGGEQHKGGYAKQGYQQDDFGKAGKAEVGSHYLRDGGFSKAHGLDGYFKNGAEYAKAGGQDQYKKYGFLVHH